MLSNEIRTKLVPIQGFLLHFLPRKDVENLHLVRLVLLFTFSTAILFGTIKYGVDGAGAIAVLVSAFVAAYAWKKEVRVTCRMTTPIGCSIIVAG